MVKIPVEITVSLSPANAEKDLSVIGQLVTATFDKSVVKGIQQALSNSKSIIEELGRRIQKAFNKSKLVEFVVKVAGKMGAVGEKVKKTGAKVKGGAISGKMLGVLGGILGMVLSLKPIQVILKMLGQMFNLIFLPIGMIMLALLIPALLVMTKLLTSSTFQGMIKDTAKFIPFMIRATNTFIAGIVPALTEIWNIIMTAYKDLIGLLNPSLATMRTIYAALHTGFGWIMAVLTPLFDFYKMEFNLLKWGFNLVVGVLRPVASFLSGGFTKGVGNAVGSFFSGIAHLSGGGMVAQSGLAVIHSGETVVPAHTSVGHTFNISVNTGNGGAVNGRDIAKQIQAELEKRIGRIQGW